MRLPEILRKRLLLAAFRTIEARKPDVTIGPPDDVYLERWFVIPRNRVFNIYLHRFRRSDDDRALHDHPWWNLSLVLHSGYVEERPVHRDAPSGRRHATYRRQGSLLLRRPRQAHRLALLAGEPRPITLFLTGPRQREWGFWCPQGWRHWKKFTAAGPTHEGQLIGLGCGEDPEETARRIAP